MTSVDAKLGGFQVRMVCRWAFSALGKLGDLCGGFFGTVGYQKGVLFVALHKPLDEPVA